MVKVIIHTGHISLDNGASNTISQYFALARAVGVEANTGEYHGSDSIEVEDNDLPVVEEILVDTHMLYKVEGRDTQWQNVKTEAVRKRLAYPHF